MKKWAILLVFVGACGEATYDKRVDAIADEAAKGPIGLSADYWFEKHNSYGEWERVALIFGYGDDYDGCTSIATAYKASFPADEYRCSPANRK